MFYYLCIRFANSELDAAKEKLEIVSSAAPPLFRIFAGGFFRKSAFGLIQEYCTEKNTDSRSRYFCMICFKESNPGRVGNQDGFRGGNIKTEGF